MIAAEHPQASQQSIGAFQKEQSGWIGACSQKLFSKALVNIHFHETKKRFLRTLSGECENSFRNLAMMTLTQNLLSADSSLRHCFSTRALSITYPLFQGQLCSCTAPYFAECCAAHLMNRPTLSCLATISERPAISLPPNSPRPAPTVTGQVMSAKAWKCSADILSTSAKMDASHSLEHFSSTPSPSAQTPSTSLHACISGILKALFTHESLQQYLACLVQSLA